MICTDLADTVAQTVSDNGSKLTDKAAAVLQKIDILYPVIGQDDADKAAFAARLNA